MIDNSGTAKPSQAMKVCSCVLLFLFVGLSSASIFDYFRPDNWNGLKVKWGPIPFRYFNSMPRTAAAAVRAGFVSLGGCDSDPNFRGVRYVKGGDMALVLLYDVNGYIAGIQTMVPHGMDHDYPSRGLTPPFVEKDEGFFLTAYFVPPAIICSRGRTPQEFSEQGTGSVLLIQNGLNPETDFISAPLMETDVAQTGWVQGKCFYTMGRHYWHGISRGMSCDHFFPVFLLYNEGELNGFGWALGANLRSSRYEHPGRRVYGMVMKDPPRCLYDRGTLSTMHVFLTSRPALNHC